MTTYFDDVGAFHRKFDLPHAPRAKPRALDPSLFRFRAGFLIEELAEFVEACGYYQVAPTLRTVAKALADRNAPHLIGPMADADVAGAADALADLVYVALGTAHFMGLPFDEVWDEVQRANMTKERATSADDLRSKREHAFDVVKPEGWALPDHSLSIELASLGYSKRVRDNIARAACMHERHREHWQDACDQCKAAALEHLRANPSVAPKEKL